MAPSRNIGRTTYWNALPRGLRHPPLKLPRANWWRWSLLGWTALNE
jgi:hypothetical protein